MKQFFTIGHSTLRGEVFVEHLLRCGITALADVRSTPYSRFNPQFNRERLTAALDNHGIRYVFLGKELGARSEDPACYVEGKVQYALLARSALFQSGIDRVIDGAEKFCVALMCAEKDPLDCHRTILVGRELERRGYALNHILADGSVETHAQTMARLIARLKLPDKDLFASEQLLWQAAYERQGEHIAYVKPSRR